MGEQYSEAGGRTGRRKTTYYDILNVSTSASRSEIRSAYIRMRTTFGSQSQALYSLFDEEESQRMLSEIEEAYRVLDDDMKRPAYDQQLGISTSPSLVVDDELIVQIEPQTEPEPHTQSWPLQADRDTGASDSPNSQSQSSSFQGSPKTVVNRSNQIMINADDEIKAKMQDLVDKGDRGDGALVRKLRDLLAVSEEELQDKTKICIDYIRAIEENQYDRLPQAVFVKGFLRNLLRYLGAPSIDEIVASYAARLDDGRRQPD